MNTVYETKGTCSRSIIIDVDDETKRINTVKFIGGCMGNTSGISSLVKGMKVEDVIARLEDTQCGRRGTSCPDQLAKALKENFI